MDKLKKVRLLFLSNMYPDSKTPSFGVFVKNVFEDFVYRGVDCKVVAIKGRKTSLLTKSLAYIYFYIKSFFLLLLTNRTVYIHYVAHTAIPVLIVSWMRNLTVVAHVHGGDVMQANYVYSTISKIKFWLSLRLLQRANKVIVPSQYFANFLNQSYQVSLEKIRISPSGGVDTTKFEHNSKKTTSDKVRLGYVGRLDSGKGVDTLINAFSKIENPSAYFLTIIGVGAREEHLRNLVRQLNLTKYVSFHGVKSHQELPIFLQEFDYFVFPSQLHESLGLVGLEAMACGLPVISTGIAGISEYFSDGENGLKFEAGNVESLVSVLHSLPKVDSKEYKMLSINARNTALKFDAQQVNSELLNEINQIHLDSV